MARAAARVTTTPNPPLTTSSSSITRPLVRSNLGCAIPSRLRTHLASPRPLVFFTNCEKRRAVLRGPPAARAHPADVRRFDPRSGASYVYAVDRSFRKTTLCGKVGYPIPITTKILQDRGSNPGSVRKHQIPSARSLDAHRRSTGRSLRASAPLLFLFFPPPPSFRPLVMCSAVLLPLCCGFVTRVFVAGGENAYASAPIVAACRPSRKTGRRS